MDMEPNRPDLAMTASDEEVDLRHYLHVILKRKWTILSILLSVVASATLYVLMQPAIYASTVTLVVEPTGPNVLSSAMEEVYVPTVNTEYYKTQHEILRSHQVLREVVLSLNLSDHPEYGPQPPGPLASVVQWLRLIVTSTLEGFLPSQPQTEVTLPQSEMERRLVYAFKQHVTIKHVPNSRVIRVTAESIDPDFAARAANTIASVYIARSLDLKVGASEEAVRWISGRVDELRQKVEKSDRALAEFASRYGLVNVDQRRRLSTQKLADLNAQLVQAETQRAEAEVRFRQIASVVDNPKKLESAGQVLRSPLIQNLRAQEVKAAQKVAELGEKYGPKHPAMVRVSSELREVHARIEDEIRKIYAAVKAEYNVALARERVITNALNQQKGEVIDASQHEVRYGILERQAETDRQLYEMFLKRMKETDIGTDIRTSNVYVADPGIVSLIPVKPKKRLTILLAAILGLFGGIGFAFFLEFWDSSLKSPDDVLRYFPNLPFLGFLPAHVDGRKDSGKAEMAMHESPHSLFAEHLRSIRTNLVLSAADQSPRSMLVTSAVQEEGKSCFAIGLAIAFAQLGKPTVIIDGDLRKPSLHKVFRLRVKRGLTHYLIGEEPLEEITQPTPIEHLMAIPCGVIPPNPAELLQSRRMKELLERFRKEEVNVIVDGSPVMNVADPAIVGHYVDGVVLVTRAGHTSRQAVHMAAKMLQDQKAKLLGLVLQRMSKRDLSTYYRSYYPYNEARYYLSDPNEALVKRS